ncbi:mitochondrial amidoxime-reducing component 1 isoform X2 [Solea solea]|uniref:mitochondrial amidoxime-reducing component 1 isoform X2 n=1 Tax=Solea solea TaxID=90069 RepID=UPI00272AE475|nr:mitochondrial amidoxime-reducing component 1 isoform X2 [Solea solea]
MEVKTQVLNALAENKRSALLVLGAGVGAAALLGFGLAFKYLRKPEKLLRVGVVSQLLVHPLKSGKALSVALAECHKFGLSHGQLQDRHWLVVTEDGRMVTGVHQPSLVLVSLTCDRGQLCLNGPNMDKLNFPLEQSNNPVIHCRVYRGESQGRDCGDEVSRWLTRYFGVNKTFRLVHFEPQMKGRQSPETLFSPYERLAYTDVGPVMLLSEASVHNLSSKSEKDLNAKQFRPNIVISDCEAFAEDSWDEIQIGNVRLQRVMSCGRCLFTTVDPDTGIFHRKEPYQTLKSYRLCDPSEKHIYKSSPLFGQLHTVKKTGILQVGDVVYTVSC